MFNNLLYPILLIGCLVGQPVSAQTFPSRPLQLVVPFTPGAATDQLGRFVAENLTRRLGQPVVVMNRPGAGSQIGIDYVAKAPADGYTLLFATSDGMSVLPAVKPHLPYVVERDFVPIARIATTPLALAISSKLPVSTVQELIAYAKANPGKLRYGSVGEGSYGHMLTVLLGSITDTKMTHIPYKGMAPVVNDLLAGHIDLALVTPPTLATYAESDRIRILTVSSATRHPALPKVPAAKEVGLSGFDVEAWFAVFAPSATPATVVSRLAKEIDIIMTDPMVTDQLRQRGVIVAPLSGVEFGRLVTTDLKRWRELARTAKIAIND